MEPRKEHFWERGSLTESAVQRFYRFQAPVYDWTRWAFLYGRSRAVELLGLGAGSCVLDVGCGTGLNFRHMQRWLDPGQGGRIVGVDLSEDMLRRARRRVARRGWGNVALVAGDAGRIRLGRDFDAVLFAYSLTLMPDWQGALERAWEHLRPGGRLVVLDFGTLENWGPAGRVLLGWMRLNHVEPCRSYSAKLAEMFPGLQLVQRLSGYYFIAMGRKG